jgi:Stage II sporulation protein E (SpoIIE)/GAF domain/PAS fold
MGVHTLLPQLTEDGGPARRGPDLAGLAVFTLDPAGRVSAWSVTAQRLLGRPAASALGRPVADVLPAGQDGGERLAGALAEVTAGRTWSGVLPPRPAVAGEPGGGMVPEGTVPLAVHCEPLDGPGSGALVIARQAPSRPGPDLISEAATRIGSTLDLPRTAREFTEVAVPAFADAAAIFVSERLLAADEPSAEGPGPAAVVRRLAARLAGQPAGVTGKLLRQGEVLVFGPGSPSYQAMTTLAPVVAGQLDADTEQRLARRPGAREVMTGYTSFLAVPLIARGLVLGCLTFARAAGSAGFGPTDLALAGELAARTAVCVDNARLYHRERRTAFALQQGLAPAEPRIPAAIEVASRYLPVGASVVGGDWHDIIALPGGQAALMVGDVMGHGPEAATVMVQLRTAAHALAEVGLPPDELLGRLDRMAAGMPGTPYATCICAVIDPPARICRIAKAGHPPPVLALPGGVSEVPSLPDGLPLGLAAGPYGVTELQLPPGTVLALYTDGLAESRSRPLDDGLAALRGTLSAALAQPGATLDQCCETVTQALRQRGEDDITLLLARIR